MKYIFFTMLFMILATVIKAEDLNNAVINDKIGIYFPYNIRQNLNSKNWIYNGYTGQGVSSYLEMFGIGIKYFPAKNLCLDLAFKTNLSQPNIGTIINGSDLWNSNIQDLNTYTLAANYIQPVSAKLTLDFGTGPVFNKINIRPFGLNRQVSLISIQFYTWIIRSGIEYKLTENCYFRLTVGYETSNLLEQKEVDTNRLFKYDYSSPFFIEPTITLYF